MLLDLLRRGVAAGVVAGVAYGAVQAAVMNPLVESLEHAGHDHAHGAEPVVSATTAAAVSVAGGVLWGVLLGGVFGVAYYLLEPSLPGDGSATAYALAAAGFLTVSGVPWLALPPAAPGTEQALAQMTRLAVYGSAMLLGGIAYALSLAAYRCVRGRRGDGVATAAAAATFGACVLPALAVPGGASSGPPAALATAFRWLVVFGQVGLWALLGATFAALRRRADPHPTATLDEFESHGPSAGD
jgi:hypothetical protein